MLPVYDTLSYIIRNSNNDLTHRLFLAIVLYFIIGSVVMYTAKGARGVEMIPNYTFWRDLPFLIKVAQNTQTIVHLISL